MKHTSLSFFTQYLPPSPLQFGFQFCPMNVDLNAILSTAVEERKGRTTHVAMMNERPNAEEFTYYSLRQYLPPAVKFSGREFKSPFERDPNQNSFVSKT